MTNNPPAYGLWTLAVMRMLPRCAALRDADLRSLLRYRFLPKVLFLPEGERSSN